MTIEELSEELARRVLFLSTRPAEAIRIWRLAQGPLGQLWAATGMFAKPEAMERVENLFSETEKLLREYSELLGQLREALK